MPGYPLARCLGLRRYAREGAERGCNCRGRQAVTAAIIITIPVVVVALVGQQHGCKPANQIVAAAAIVVTFARAHFSRN
jgi:hypothetical protein